MLLISVVRQHETCYGTRQTNPSNYTSLVLVYTVAITVSDNTVLVTEVTHYELLSVAKIQLVLLYIALSDNLTRFWKSVFHNLAKC